MHLRLPMFLLLSGLPLCAVAADEGADGEAADEALRQFALAHGRMLESGGEALVRPAVDRLVELGDLRAVGVLVEALDATLEQEAKLREQLLAVQRHGAVANERIQELQRELEQLRRRERAGERDVAPLLEKRQRELERQADVFDQVRGQSARIADRIQTVVDLRGAFADAAGGILAGAPAGAAVAPVYAALRERLDVVDPVESLFLVRILARGGRVDSDVQLVDVLVHPRVHAGARRAAVSALARLGTPRAFDALLGVWEREPDVWGPVVGHALGLQAGRRLDDLAQARAWVEERKAADGDASR